MRAIKSRNKWSGRGRVITERTRYLHAHIYRQVSCSSQAAVEVFSLEVGTGNTGSRLQDPCLFWSNLPSSSGLQGFQTDSGESASVCAHSSTASQAELTNELKFGFGFLAMLCAAVQRWMRAGLESCNRSRNVVAAVRASQGLLLSGPHSLSICLKIFGSSGCFSSNIPAVKSL